MIHRFKKNVGYTGLFTARVNNLSALAGCI
jgi:hypothetical protein